VAVFGLISTQNGGAQKVKKDLCSLGLCLLVVVMMAGTVSAAEYAVLIDPSGVRASEDGNYSGDTTKMTDGSGMNGNYPNNDGGLLRWPYDYAPGHPSTWTNDNQSWHADYQSTSILSGAENGKIGWITFDLGASYELAELYFWNTENNPSAGISNFNLYVATSAVGIPSSWNQDYEFTGTNGWPQFGDNDADRSTPRYIAPMATPLPALYTTNISVSGTTARYIGLEVFGSWGNASRFGLAEFAVIVVDNTAPTLDPADIADDTGGSVGVYNPVTYTLTFSEEIDTTTVTTGNLSNASSSAIVIDSITQTSANVFEVIVTPTTTGSLQLRVASSVSDWAGLSLAADVDDGNTITVGSDSVAPTATVANSLVSPLTGVGSTVGYTFTFSEYMNTNTFAAGDFSNLSNSSFTVHSITAGDNTSVINVEVTVNEAGYLDLQLDSGSVQDMSGNPTTQAWGDGVPISVVRPGLVIDEPFADSDPTLAGNASGMGLSGNWGGDGRPDITNGLSYGELITSGNAVYADTSWLANTVSVDTADPAYTALLANGGEMWFSMIYRIDTGAGRFYVTIGDSTLVNNGNLAAGQAIGFGSTGTRVFAGLWESTGWGTSNLGGPAYTSVDVTGDMTVNNDDGGTLASGGTYLIVGHVQWGVGSADDDSVTLYLPDSSDLALGTAVAKSVGQVSQDSFDTLNSNHGNGLTSTWDEIRVGATYADVIPIPPPTGMVISVK